MANERKRIQDLSSTTAPLSNNDLFIVEKGDSSGTKNIAYSELIKSVNGGLKNKRCLLIGDSYNAGVGGTSGQGWGYYFTQYSGATTTIVHQNSGGFAVAGNSNATYPNKTYAQLVASVTGEYEYIIVQSGWNDSSSNLNPTGASTVTSGVSSFVSAARTKWPYAQIIIIPVLNDTYQNDFKSQCFVAMYKAAAQNGVRTSRKSRYWMIGSGHNYTDNIHLTDAGYQLLAYYILAFVCGWDGDVAYSHDVSLTNAGASGITPSSTLLTATETDTEVYISGDVTLTAPLTSTMVTIVTGLPRPIKAIYGTTLQWANAISGTTYYNRIPIRFAVNTSGELQINYGSAGNYRITLVYPKYYV